MASKINADYPIYRRPTTQSVRDNFAIARDEITELQGRFNMPEVPNSPAGEKWVRMYGNWTPLHVDGGVF